MKITPILVLIEKWIHKRGKECIFQCFIFVLAKKVPVSVIQTAVSLEYKAGFKSRINKVYSLILQCISDFPVVNISQCDPI